MPSQPQKPPWLQVIEWVKQLDALQKQMVELGDSTVIESWQVENIIADVNHLRTLALTQSTSETVAIAKRNLQTDWLDTLKTAERLKAFLDELAEDSNVDTGLWHTALVVLNRIIRLARKVIH